jgi:hypothetical protein
MKPVILCVDDTPSVLEGEKMLAEGDLRSQYPRCASDQSAILSKSLPSPIFGATANRGTAL